MSEFIDRLRMDSGLAALISARQQSLPDETRKTALVFNELIFGGIGGTSTAFLVRTAATAPSKAPSARAQWPSKKTPGALEYAGCLSSRKTASVFIANS